MIGPQEFDITLAVAKLNFNNVDYLGIEIKYNQCLPRGTSCEYSTEVTVMNRKFNLKHHQFDNDRLYLPTFMKWDDVVDLTYEDESVRCCAKVVGFRHLENVERSFGDCSYHGTSDLRHVTTVNLTITVGRYKILVNKDYLMSMSGFFRTILENADKNSRHDDLVLTESRDEAFVTMIDICHHKFWCNYQLKEDLFEVAKLYEFPFVINFYNQFFNSDRAFNADDELSLENTM